MEQDIKKNLSDLSKIPQKEFEKHFSEWMARDDVARSLQANLRSDLIKNFNKTHLGKQIQSQTSNTTGIYGAPTQRLTLSPLILALNTLVAEFLYAQNCHFSLSVFCTEIPFRNTLPDFESSRCFRFTEPEVVDIFQALSGDANKRRDLKKRIAKDYAGSPSCSLLLLILKNLLELQKQSTVSRGTLTEEPEASQPTTQPQPSELDAKADIAQPGAAQPDTKTEIFNTNFRYLNKYLIVLSRKVKEMTQRIDNLQQRHAKPIHGSMQTQSLPLPRPRSRKSMGRRKFENLNRSLERISENLKRMTLSKRKSKRVTTIVTAVDAMAKQLEKCAAKFDEVSQNLLKREEPKQVVNTAPIVEAAPAPAAVAVTLPEKSYIDWVHEMRTTTNGEKFLSKVEISLNKALRKQKDQLQNESELKLRHQKELLKIRYKQKLLKHLNKIANEPTIGGDTDTVKQNESLEWRLKQFEKKHYELLSKIRDAEQSAQQQGAAKNSPTLTTLLKESVKESELPMAQGDHARQQDKVSEVQSESKSKLQPNLDQNKRLSEDKVEMQKKWQEMLNGTPIEDKYVQHIVCDAKLRIRELENESNQLEQSFRNYLEQQRLLKEASREASQKMWTNYTEEKQKIEKKYRLVKENIRRQENQRRRRRKSCKNSDIEEDESEEDTSAAKHKNCLKSNSNSDLCRQRAGASVSDRKSKQDATIILPRNAILEARDKLFDKESKLKRFQRLEDLERAAITDNNNALGMQLIFMRSQLDDVPNYNDDDVDKMTNPVLNSTFTAFKREDYHDRLDHDFEISSSSSDSVNAHLNATKNISPNREQKANLRHKKHGDEMEQQQLSKASGYNKAAKDSFKRLDEREKKLHKSCIQSKSNINKENHEQQQEQQLKKRTTIEAALCQLEEGVPIDTKTTKMMMIKTTAVTTTTTTTTLPTLSMTLKSKTVPTSLVLQQSMAKMNKLFGEEHERCDTTESKTNRRAALKTTAATTTTTTTTPTSQTLNTELQQQQQQSNFLVESIPHADVNNNGGNAVVAPAVASYTAFDAPIITTNRRHSIAASSTAHKVQNKNFNKIEKNNETETTITESMATLKSALLGQKQQQLLATNSTEQLQHRQGMHNINNGNEAQALNVDNGRVNGDKRQQGEQEQEQQTSQGEPSIQKAPAQQTAKHHHKLKGKLQRVEKIRQKQMNQDTATAGQLGVKSECKTSRSRGGGSEMSNSASNSTTSNDLSDAQPGEQQSVDLKGQHVNDQQLEIGEIIDASIPAAPSGADIGVAAVISDAIFIAAATATSATAVADTRLTVHTQHDSGSSGSSVTSFDLQLSNVGGGRGGEGSEKTDDSVSGFWT